MRLLLATALCLSAFPGRALPRKTKKDTQSFYGIIKVKRVYKEDKTDKDPRENFTVKKRVNTSGPFAGSPASERLTGKEALVLENGTLEVQWELRRRR